MIHDTIVDSSVELPLKLCAHVASGFRLLVIMSCHSVAYDLCYQGNHGVVGKEIAH